MLLACLLGLSTLYGHSQTSLADIAAFLETRPLTGNWAKGPGSGVARGQEMFAKDCAGCHGNAGEGNAAIFAPMVAAQHYTYLLREPAFIRDGKRATPT